MELARTQMQIFKTQKSVESEMRGVAVTDRKRVKDLILMLGFSEAIDEVGYGKQCALAWSSDDEGG